MLKEKPFSFSSSTAAARSGVRMAMWPLVPRKGAFQPVGEETFRRALAALEACPRAVCCLESFGPLNDCNRRLAQAAGGKLVPLEEI